MENYYKRKSTPNRLSPTLENDNNDLVPSTSKKSREDVNLEDLPADPGLRNPISSYHPMDQDQIRRAYLQKGPCQPREHKFPYTGCGQDKRRFNPAWFEDYGSWLEYSIEKDAAFCLCCYLFGNKEHRYAFIIQGFQSWRKKGRIEDHVRGPNSAHNQAHEKCRNLLNQKEQIETIIVKQSNQAGMDYPLRLKATLHANRFFLRQGLPFRGHDEYEDSINIGNFLELLQVLANQNEDIKRVVLQNAPENLKLTSPKIQKDIVNASALETTHVIISNLEDAPFALLVDESRDISIKEQTAVVIHYVDERGCIIERFLAIEHVKNTKAQSLKAAIEVIFSRHGLSITSLRGQGYDGAGNMKGELNGFQRLIQNENPTTFYVHCFAHQLQLTLIAITKQNNPIAAFFDLVSTLFNVVGGSCKRHDMLQNIQAAKVIEALNTSKLESGQSLNQETSLKRPGDTRWGSHYDTLISLIHMFSSVVDVLEIISDDDISEHKGSAINLLHVLEDFDFVFKMHVMRDILGITNEASKALQRKDQDTVSDMELVRISKQRLQLMR